MYPVDPLAVAEVDAADLVYHVGERLLLVGQPVELGGRILEGGYRPLGDVGDEHPAVDDRWGPVVFRTRLPPKRTGFGVDDGESVLLAEVHRSIGDGRGGWPNEGVPFPQLLAVREVVRGHYGVAAAPGQVDDDDGTVGRWSPDHRSVQPARDPLDGAVVRRNPREKSVSAEHGSSVVDGRLPGELPAQIPFHLAGRNGERPVCVFRVRDVDATVGRSHPPRSLGIGGDPLTAPVGEAQPVDAVGGARHDRPVDDRRRVRGYVLD